ncbi:MAG: T9SS type A sorting domain-containing protein [Ignavibacteriaceae bacterium]|nr:T9SS type A sorting domain-containing protein [Ignavibacteriaceae bacterium]
MKDHYTTNSALVILLIFTFFIPIGIKAQQETSFQYVSPKPNSIMVSNETNIILRHTTKLQEPTINQTLISVIGSKSGIHKGDFLLTDDDQTIVFNPHKAFAYNEIVNVSVQRGIKTLSNFEVPEYSFSFNTETEGIIQIYDGVFDEDMSQMQNLGLYAAGDNSLVNTLQPPPITIDSLNNPGPGYIFMATWDRNIPQMYGNFIFILDNEGQIVDSLRVNGAAFDFKVQPNGLLSYGVGNFAGALPRPGEEFKYFVMDSTFAAVDSFQMKNGYSTDFHEFLMLPNGHVMLMSFHTIIFDMSTIIPGGKTDCRLTIAVLQEQDSDGNVVFEWRDLDHIPITDSDEDLTGPTVLYTALNGFDLDDDGNILMSFRHLSEIIKINRATGEVIWRMGSPRSEFTYVGEHEENAPYYHARQHHIQRLPNGNVTLFDNGEYHQPPYSRAVEYSLDEVNKVATLVSEWRYPNGNIFAALAGNAQRFPDGRWFICYGAVHPQFSQVIRHAIEVHDDGSIALELSLPPGVLAYRIYKMPWNELIKKPSVTHFEVLEGFTYTFNDTLNSIFTDVAIKYIDVSTGYNEVTITRLPFGPVQPQFNEDVNIVYPVSIIYQAFLIYFHTSEIHINLSKYPEIKHPEKTSFFIRENPNQGVFTMLPTTYDSLTNELIATTSIFGEIVFGETDDIYTANTPIPYEPANYKKVLPLDSLALRWTGQGYYDLFQLQIFSDSMYSDIIIDTTLNSSFYILENLTNNSIYFWRVRSILGSEVSNWSTIWSFEVTDAFITMNTPNGGEAWSIGSENVIRWETNIADSVRLDLLYGQQIVRFIDSTYGNPSAYAWLIPTDLTVDTSYKIIITSLADPLLVDTSDASFSITPPSGVEIVELEIPEDYHLFQNYPNPFNPKTAIEFQLPVRSAVTLKIYDALSNEIAVLVDEEMESGSYKVDFNAVNIASGIYFYRIQAGYFVQTKKMILMK